MSSSRVLVLDPSGGLSADTLFFAVRSYGFLNSGTTATLPLTTWACFRTGHLGNITPTTHCDGFGAIISSAPTFGNAKITGCESVIRGLSGGGAAIRSFSLYIETSASKSRRSLPTRPKPTSSQLCRGFGLRDLSRQVAPAN